jgi:hypothetical protein
MKVKILTSMVGAAHSWAPGDRVNVPAAEAKRLIAAGFAETAQASNAGVETAARKSARSK